MAGRNDVAIAAALEAVAQAVEQQPNVNAEVRMLETFLRNHPPTFKGRYDPDGELCRVFRVFRVMQCTEVQKVRFGTHMLAVIAIFGCQVIN